MPMTIDTFDTIVVGAGSAGCVLANRLSADGSRRVLVLEAGGPPPIDASIPAHWLQMLGSEVDWGFHTAPQAGCKGRRLYWPRGRMLGGSGSLNAMIYMRGLPSDYDGWEAAGCTGWGWRDVLPVFKRSECNLRFTDSPWHGNAGELVVSDIGHIDPIEHIWLEAAQAAGLPLNDDFNGASQHGVGLFQATVKDGERFGTARAFLAPAQRRPNLTLRTGVRLLRITLSGTRATGVEYLENGRPRTATATSEVVLAAGAIGSPQLLLHSGIGPAGELAPLGIDTVVDLPGVGKNLQDHVNGSISFATHERFGIAHATAAEAAAHRAAWDEARSGPLTSNGSACGGFATLVPNAAGPDLQLYCIASGHRDHGRYLAAGAGVSFFAVVQRPESRGELRLRSADPLDAPLIDPRYFSDRGGDGGRSGASADLALLVDGIRLNRAIAARSPLAERLGRETSASAGAESDADLADFVRGHAATLYHPTSSCKMGVDAQAVVDPGLRVHGTLGLYVADASVFPTMISGNTNAPVVMVAERAADGILGRAGGAGPATEENTTWTG